MPAFRLRAAVLLSAAAVVPATAAQAATRTVYMGVPPSGRTALQKYGADSNDFFPARTTIRVGDRIGFVPAGFHNIDLPAKGGSPTPLIAPTGDKVAGAADAVGAPFWFNGLDVLGFTPSLLRSNFGKRLSVPAAQGLNSGLPPADRPEPVLVRFRKVGAYTFFCDVHPRMKTTIRVLGRRARVPSAKAHARALAAQIGSATVTARKLLRRKVPVGAVLMGHEQSGTVLRGFFPTALSVRSGTTVSFRMPAASREVHTATFGPGDPDSEPASYLGRLAASFETPAIDPRIDPAATYASELPGTPTPFGPALHGNGFWNSGLLDSVGDSPLPEVARVRFDTPGSYDYYCLVHPSMHATVRVG